jgi:hypothetical protein
VIILREWLRELAERHQPRIIVMVGFSLGADMGFELLLGPTDEPGPAIDTFLSLECNLSLDTCFVSGRKGCSRQLSVNAASRLLRFYQRSGCLKGFRTSGSRPERPMHSPSRSDVLSAPRPPGDDPEARVIACYVLRHCFHSGFEILVGRIDEKPLS